MAGEHDVGASRTFDSSLIRSFVVIDRYSAVLAVIFLLLVNGLAVRSAQVWLVLPVIVALIGFLTAALRAVDAGQILRCLALVALGNWAVAIVVPIPLPFLWPAMVLTVLMPLALAAPYVDSTNIIRAILATATAASIVAAIGLLRDDEGALPDIEDELEVLIVIGGIVAMIAPIGLIIWQTNRLQRDSLDEANVLTEDLLESRRALADSRRRIVLAADAERSRIERDLHDGAQQHLVALGVHLRLMEATTDDGSEINETAAMLVGKLDLALEEIRELAHGIYPPLLETRGLSEALGTVARRSPLTVELDLDDPGRLDREVEAALYFTASEAMANAGKHAEQSTVTLRLHRAANDLLLVVADDGPGFDVDERGPSRGLLNMSDRIASIGGTLTVDSVPAKGTTVTASIPIERSNSMGPSPFR